MHALKPMTPLQKEIFDMCLEYLYEHENPQQVIKNAPLFNEGYDAFGITDEEQRELRQLVLDRYNPTPSEIADLGRIFFSTHKYELCLLAIQLIKKHRPRMNRYVYEGVLDWLEDGVENISHADLLATKITPVFLELGIASLDDFETWRTSKSRWTRRVAALTMLYLMDKASPERLLEFIEPMINDADKTVQQGVGYFLRELWGLHSEEVEEFLFKHKDKVGATVSHYATFKMSKEKKKRLVRSPGGKPTANKGFHHKPSPPPGKKPRPQAKAPFKQKNQAHPGQRRPNPNWNKPGPAQQNRNFYNKNKPNTVTPEFPDHIDDNLPGWDDFDDKY